jgi:probable blue pigment (indigoidine) exporter
MVRDVARARTIDALSLTALPIALGAIVLLPVALLAEGPPHASLTAWIIVFTLALLNTVAAFLLYSHVLQRFTALTLATILNLNPLVTAVLAWIFLGNRLSLVQIAALLLVLVSAAAVQAADPRQESPRRRQA